ncbi:hypothetical protein Goshw_022817 [Gossypium schwendimanii]|uniref:DUF4283 domain-containing protein n=1 Tax=Gossypium schwendimanii TaxID=34291 RepID=A0A7J9N147_GOSSC|nr:hypothetical protein [Gossypium schwendimanii]
MKESGGNDGFGGDEISLVAEELIQLSVKSSMVEPNGKPSLICSIWTKKSYNQHSFKAQMKSIWKTKKKFEIQSVGQNIFLIVFESEEDLETVMEEAGIEIQKEGEINEEKIENSKADEDILKPVRKASWRRIEPMGVMRHYEAESKLQKRKLTEILYDDYGTKETREDTTKRMRYDGQDIINEVETSSLTEVPNQNKSVAAKRQADQTQ